MSKVITFGEIMLRLAPEGYLRFVQAESFGAVYGGSEANVALSLSVLGADASPGSRRTSWDRRRSTRGGDTALIPP